jgi:hypothetical protein
VLQHFKAAHAGHHGIQKQKIKVTFPKPGKPCRAVLCYLYLKVMGSQCASTSFPDAKLIINNEYPQWPILVKKVFVTTPAGSAGIMAVSMLNS